MKYRFVPALIIPIHFVKRSFKSHKNFWFYQFCSILALETVESSYPYLLTTGIFQIPINNKINNKTDWVISNSINNSFLCTTFCS
jgi:hypothetical protein